MVVLFSLVLGISAYVQAQAISEIPVTITSVDLAANSVTLEGLELAATEYRLAFDVIIKLFNGDAGTANNLRVGDSVTAVVDQAAGVVHKIYVVGRAS